LGFIAQSPSSADYKPVHHARHLGE